MSASEWIITVPVVTLVIMAITFIMSTVFQTTNRIIINRFLGWDNYRAMRKEISEFQKESMAAARANDKKQLEKIKKKQSQINAMNAKMMKPQMIQMAISFCYLPLWLVLNPFLAQAQIGDKFGVAVIPYFGPLPFFVWYMISSFFMGAMMMRIMGTSIT
jgi:uncharacterized membrane protein (DUF106 family)